MEIRQARSKVLLDADDVVILHKLSQQDYFLLNRLKEYLYLSHKALLVHIERLISNDLIHISRLKENYKIKVCSLTEHGKEYFRVLYKSQNIQKIIGGFVMNRQNKELKKIIDSRYK